MYTSIFKNNYTHLLVIVSINIFYTFIINEYIQTDSIYYNFLLSNYPTEIANRVFEYTISYKFTVYILAPVIIILRTLTFAVILDAILACRHIYDQGNLSLVYRFRDFWRIFIFAEWSYILFITVKFVWFAFLYTDYNYKDLVDYSPLSLYNLIDHQDMDPWLVYPTKMFNLFELLYLAIATVACKKILKMSRIDSLFYISISYVIPLFIFIIFIMYLNIHFMS